MLPQNRKIEIFLHLIVMITALVIIEERGKQNDLKFHLQIFFTILVMAASMLTSGLWVPFIL